MAQTRSLTVAQGFNVPFGHRTLQVSGNSAAVESFAGLDHGGKYGVAGVLTFNGHSARVAFDVSVSWIPGAVRKANPGLIRFAWNKQSLS
jgi:hypothetical protein